MQNFNDYTSSTNSTKIDGNAYNMISDFAKKYEGASQSDLISAIMVEAEKGRKNGTLKDEDVERFAQMIAPMLNGAQRKQLEAVVKKIKQK